MKPAVRYTLCFVLGIGLVGVWRLGLAASSSLVERGTIAVPAPPEARVRVYMTSDCGACRAVLHDFESTPELAALFYPVAHEDEANSDFALAVCELQLSSVRRWWFRPTASPGLCERLHTDALEELERMDGVIVGVPAYATEGRVVRMSEVGELLAGYGVERDRDTRGLRLVSQ